MIYSSDSLIYPRASSASLSATSSARIFSAFRSKGDAWLKSVYQADGLHPGPEGAAFLAELVADRLAGAADGGILTSFGRNTRNDTGRSSAPEKNSMFIIDIPKPPIF